MNYKLAAIVDCARSLASSRDGMYDASDLTLAGGRRIWMAAGTIST